MRIYDRWNLLTLAARLWWLGVRTEWQRNRLQNAVERGMALSDPTLIELSRPFQALCVEYLLLERAYGRQRQLLPSRAV